MSYPWRSFLASISQAPQQRLTHSWSCPLILSVSGRESTQKYSFEVNARCRLFSCDRRIELSRQVQMSPGCRGSALLSRIQPFRALSLNDGPILRLFANLSRLIDTWLSLDCIPLHDRDAWDLGCLLHWKSINDHSSCSVQGCTLKVYMRGRQSSAQMAIKRVY